MHHLAHVCRRLLPVCVLVLAGGCGNGDARTGDPDLQIRWSTDPETLQVGGNTFTVTVADVDWRPRNGARVIITGVRDSVELVVDTARGQGAGKYIAEGVRFPVAGDWILRIHVANADGRWTELERPVKVELPES